MKKHLITFYFTMGLIGATYGAEDLPPQKSDPVKSSPETPSVADRPTTPHHRTGHKTDALGNKSLINLRGVDLPNTPPEIGPKPSS